MTTPPVTASFPGVPSSASAPRKIDGGGRREDGIAESVCAYARIEEVDKPEVEEQAHEDMRLWRSDCTSCCTAM
ncbi:hypothetical protein FOMPIDRAFT_122506 [Fomitopsis schrenkii]|uniref:Uncharacterized protein n=1 Tax=Fomitopsis schrenkii TaxID=2126942 RepID=S8DV39_FOMSC|nr:hypothetical protein FOMPIDRAFT_122506 [Fomitopsis schrenkii]